MIMDYVKYLQFIGFYVKAKFSPSDACDLIQYIMDVQYNIGLVTTQGTDDLIKSMTCKHPSLSMWWPGEHKVA